MMYFEDMLSMYGFSDGRVMPPDAMACRAVYVKTINCLAEAAGSEVRIVAYNRPGIHNWCMLMFVPKESIADRSEEEIAKGSVPNRKFVNWWGKADPDKAMQTAISDAMELEVEVFVETTVIINEERLDKFLKGECHARKL